MVVSIRSYCLCLAFQIYSKGNRNCELSQAPSCCVNPYFSGLPTHTMDRRCYIWCHIWCGIWCSIFSVPCASDLSLRVARSEMASSKTDLLEPSASEPAQLQIWTRKVTGERTKSFHGLDRVRTIPPSNKMRNSIHAETFPSPLLSY